MVSTSGLYSGILSNLMTKKGENEKLIRPAKISHVIIFEKSIIQELHNMVQYPDILKHSGTK